MAHFLVLGLVYEIFYQQNFCLAIGLYFAVPVNRRKPVKFLPNIQARALCCHAISCLMLQNINDTSVRVGNQMVTI